MTNERFCELHNMYSGESARRSGLDFIDQLTYESLTGQELKDFVEFCIKEEQEQKHTKH